MRFKTAPVSSVSWNKSEGSGSFLGSLGPLVFFYDLASQCPFQQSVTNYENLLTFLDPLVPQAKSKVPSYHAGVHGFTFIVSSPVYQRHRPKVGGHFLSGQAGFQGWRSWRFGSSKSQAIGTPPAPGFIVSSWVIVSFPPGLIVSLPIPPGSHQRREPKDRHSRPSQYYCTTPGRWLS